MLRTGSDWSIYLCLSLSLYIERFYPCDSIFMRHKIDINHKQSYDITMITTPLPLLLLLQMLIIFFLFFPSIFGLNSDKTTLLSFKQSLISHQLSLQTWNQADPNPCSWIGVTCTPQNGQVTTLSLPNSNLIGSIPTDFHLQHLQVLNLSNNSINGTLPISLFNSELQKVDLSCNFITGDLPAEISTLQSLRTINLSNNMFFGELPKKLGFLKNLRNISLMNNYFSGKIPSGFDSVQVFDISSNLFNGSLPIDFNGGRLNYLNISNNKLSGYVYHEFAEKITANAVIDLSYNNFTGQIPQTSLFWNQKTKYFAGNLDLCGKPLKKVCTVPSTLSTPPPNVTSDGSETAAIAAIPENSGKLKNHGGRKVGCGKIVAIVVGDLVAIMIFYVVFVYVYRFRKKKMNEMSKEIENVEPEGESTQGRSQSCIMNRLSTTCSCFKCETGEEEPETTEFESDNNNNNNHIIIANDDEKEKHLVMVDGETELEIESLLKASAYILGSSNGSIVYKAVIGGDVAFAVRRIADCEVAKMEDFEKIVRTIGKFRHRNLVKICGFYWDEEEKLVIYEYVNNGSLAGAAYKKVGSSTSCHLSFEARLKIAKGIAKGLSYIHEKKHVHGNIKPSNILLTSEMEPLISDFGREWLMSGKTNYISNKSIKNIDNRRSTSLLKDVVSSHGCISPYHAPESMKTLKPNPRWDVYSFGIILLELLSGKVLSGKELSQWNIDSSISDNETKILKIVNEFSTDMHDRKDSIVTCFKLGFTCASLSPQNRPSMKEALQVLQKIPCPS